MNGGNNMNSKNEETREIIFEQLQLLKEKSRESKCNIEIVALTNEMQKLASVLLSKNFI
ncbi:hypothetical protein ACOJIU_18035 (plasmid) [Carnobacterium maltaromaticum]|uniref:hypothetical protein n=1 Tax=Carnobacterium maltaromaticum TaxID=2751 RepID=UPI00344C5751